MMGTALLYEREQRARLFDEMQAVGALLDSAAMLHCPREGADELRSAQATTVQVGREAGA